MTLQPRLPFRIQRQGTTAQDHRLLTKQITRTLEVEAGLELPIPGSPMQVNNTDRLGNVASAEVAAALTAICATDGGVPDLV